MELAWQWTTNIISGGDKCCEEKWARVRWQRMVEGRSYIGWSEKASLRRWLLSRAPCMRWGSRPNWSVPHCTWLSPARLPQGWGLTQFIVAQSALNMSLWDASQGGKADLEGRVVWAGLGNAGAKPTWELRPFASSFLLGHSSVYSPSDQFLKHSLFCAVYFTWGIFKRWGMLVSVPCCTVFLPLSTKRN